jgi:hypothetical protein
VTAVGAWWRKRRLNYADAAEAWCKFQKQARLVAVLNGGAAEHRG